MSQLYQQKHICKTLGLTKQRIEYLMLKAEIKPSVAAQGTGTTNLFDFEAVLVFDIANSLSRWGFSFPRVREILSEIKESKPEIFIPLAPKDFQELPPTEQHCLLFITAIPEQTITDLISVKAGFIIDKAIDIYPKSEISKIIHKAASGIFCLNLTVRKYGVIDKLFMS